MGCTNCFSGCVETTSDRCVKYTGSTIEFLGITTGDSLDVVEKAITDYLATVLSGVGIVPSLDPNDICAAVQANLPCAGCGDYTLLQILTAIIKTICDLEEEIVVERERIDTIEANYTVGCVSVAADAGTHAVLQAVITELCSAIGDITTLQNLYATCITTATIDTYIQNYLNGISVDTKAYSKMVPYVAYPYFNPDLTPFGVTGAGTGVWEKVYLCNGYGGLTPDLRGRILVGTAEMAGMSTDPATSPMLDSNNPNYALNTKYGANVVAISEDQMPSHTHSLSSDGEHKHLVTATGWEDLNK